MRKDSPAHRFELTGGALCLDFVNTLGDRPRGLQEHLKGHDDLLEWARQADALPQEDLERLERAAREQPDAAHEAFGQAIALRESLYRILAARGRGESVPLQDLTSVNQALQEALGHLELSDSDGMIRWSWGGREVTLDRLLWPVLRSAGDLLTSDEASSVRECAADDCSWLFIDRSRTRRRRWCDMSTCGNRAKAKRHYRRQKARARSK